MGLKVFLFSVFFFLSASFISAQHFRIYGTVRDHDTGELISDVSVTVSGSNSGATSNSYGFYSLRLNSGEYIVKWSYIGYVSCTQSIRLMDDVALNITLKPSSVELAEVEISVPAKVAQSPGVDAKQLKITEIRSMPVAFSEPDIFKSLQTLPGVQVSHPGSSNISVRGGSYSQNLVLLDDAPVYNPSHVLGFFSSFNPDAVSAVNIYKGVPARYGKMLSSVVDVRMKEGNREHYATSGGIGLISSRLLFEGPLPGSKGSFLVAGRFCYAGLPLKAGSKIVESISESRSMSDAMRNRINSKTNIWFYDLNLKTNYTINSKNRLFLSVYSGFDKFFFPNFSGEYLLQWGNANGTLRWNHIFGPSLFVNTSFIVSRYNYAYYQMNHGLNYRWDASLGNIELKSDAEYAMSDVVKIRFGVSIASYRFDPGNISPLSASDVTACSFSLQRNRSLENGIFAEIHWEPLPKLLISGGVRLSAYATFGPGVVYDFDPVDHHPVDSTEYRRFRLMQNFANLNPRASVSYSFGASTVRASYTNMAQYLHKASNSTLGMPTDIWFAASKNISPQLANQFSVGYALEWGAGYAVSVEPYFKKMYRQVDFRDGADLFVNPYLEGEIRSGNGLSKGIELMTEKMAGKLTGRLSYTWSSTTFKIEGVNNNREFAAPYDSRHNFSAYLSYTLSKRWTFASSFKYVTGRPFTAPTGMFNYQSVTFLTYSERNAFRLEDFHQLDVSFTFKPKPKRKNYQGTWNFSILDVYNRKNTFSLLFKPDQIHNSADPYLVNPQPAKKLYLYGIFPSVSYDFRF